MNKTIVLALMALLLLVLIPVGFAADNGTDILSQETANVTQAVSISLDENTLTASNDYYFNASAENDGNGSIDNPYKYLKANRIPSNANLYLADGEYQLDTSKTIQQVNIIGSDVDKTIIRYNGVAFTVSNQFTVKNVTFIGASISNNAKFSATNTVFEDGFGSKPDHYGNNYGGAIFTINGNSNSYITVDNCTFKSNYAEYGGAIYMNDGSLNVSNSIFYDNIAYNYGGAIACEYAANITISKSKFYNSRSLNDAGGSIYIRQSSKFNEDHVDVVNSSSTFGGAITTLNTPVSLNYVNMADNSAKYDGGAIFHMYGTFSLTYSEFKNNSAINGGALFIDNSTGVFVRSNTFTNNKATGTGGAIYSLLNKLLSPYYLQNRYTSNEAAYNKDYYDTSTLDLTIGSGNYTMYSLNATPITSLPSRYDLREEGYVTNVKDQQSGGNCWAFPPMVILESCVLKATGELLDLSEENMKNIIALYSDYGWKMDTNEGGYDNMPWGYLVSWLGPVNEIDDLYDDKSTLSPILNSIMHVQNIKFLHRASYTDNDEIKWAILNYGAVGAGIYQDSYYLNSKTYAYYCWKSTSCNHAVTIVGWDDDYPKTNFKYGSEIEGNGAWIVRNSWGDSWQDHGYYYVSYYDANFARPNGGNNAYTIILNDTIKFDKNYQYDIGGMTDYFLNSSSKVWYKNIFTAASDEYLAAVSTYFEKVSNWTASVVVNGELKDVLSGNTDPGYYTFNLNKYIPLKTGDVFEVIFNITVCGEASFPISEIYSLNKLVYRPQTSYLSYDGENWTDLYDLTWNYSSHTYSSQVACIKAFTYLNPINTLTNLSVVFTGDRPLIISAIVKDEYGNPVKYGNVTFNVNGENQNVSVVNGNAILLYDYTQKINTISATFNAEGYNPSSNSTTVTITKVYTEIIIANDALRLEVNDEVAAGASLTPADAGGLTFTSSDETVAIVENGKIKALAEGNAVITVSFNGDYKYDDAENKTITVTVVKLSIASSDVNMTYKDGSAFEVQLVDNYGNPFAKANEAVNITIDGRTYTRLTDENGVAKVTINLGDGIYPVTAQYGNTTVDNVVTVNKLPIVAYDVNMTYKDGSAYIVQLVDKNGNPFAKANEAVNITIAGKTYSRLTNGSGVAKVTINLGAGTYPVTAQYGNTIVNNVVTVNKLLIVASDVSMIYRDGSAYMVQLVDKNGIPFAKANEAVNITIAGRTYTRLTNESGVAKITINLGAGIYQVTAQYGNTIVNNVVTVNNKFSIMASDVNMTYKDGSAFEVQLVDQYGNPFAKANEAVNITIDGRTYARLTNESGVAKIIINLGAGIYPVTAQYGNTIVNNVVTVNNRLSIVACDLNMSYRDGSAYMVQLVDSNGNPYAQANEAISITVAGRTYTRLTDENGIAKITINLGAGTYSVTAEYNNKTINNTITVNKT